ncbi:MAG: copper chaperone PCu(A)C [Cellvibrio sp.]
MKFIIKCVGVLLIVFNVQAALAAEAATKNSASSKKEVLDIKVTNAFIYVPLGANKATTGFFTITNQSSSDVSITGANAKFAKQIKLTPKENWVIPAHGSLTLKPGGNFLQINDLKNKLTTGDELHLTLSLSNGQKLYIIAVAKSAYDQTHGH